MYNVNRDSGMTMGESSSRLLLLLGFHQLRQGMRSEVRTSSGTASVKLTSQEEERPCDEAPGITTGDVPVVPL